MSEHRQKKRFGCTGNFEDVIFDLRSACERYDTFTFSIRDMKRDDNGNVRMNVGEYGFPVRCDEPFKLRLTYKIVSRLSAICDLIINNDDDGDFEIEGFCYEDNGEIDSFNITFQLYSSNQSPWSCGEIYSLHGWLLDRKKKV